MRLPKTISKLRRMPAVVANLAGARGADRLSDLAPPADNPGRLNARVFVPADLPPGAPLVVVLHGCTQTVADYDAGSGWSHLAERHGFALLYPEQTRANNPNGCFNWFQPGDTRRGGGEVASIRAMVAAVVATHAIDPARVFVTGLSAGGAMTGALLAAYPETYAAGAIIAGLPYGCASGVPEAFEAMGGRGAPVDAATLGDRVRAASPHAGPWPRVSVWHGDADHTVAPGNADAIVRQWTDVHGLAATPTMVTNERGFRRGVWADADGSPLVEHILIEGMGHGTPLDPGTAPGQSGEARAHMLDVGISSTDRIAAFFGIAPALEETSRVSAAPQIEALEAGRPRLIDVSAPPSGPQKVIEDALRAAGLMR